MNNAITAARLALLSYKGHSKSHTDGDYFDHHLSGMFTQHSYGEHNVGSLQYYTITDNKDKNFYVVIRGTDTNNWKEQLRDLLVSFNMWSMKHNGLKYHRGFLKNGKRIYHDIKDVLHTMYDNGYTIIFTGHSLGGAIAKVLAQLFDKECELYDFGSPRIMKKEFPNKNITVHKSYVVYGDMIPSFPSNKYRERIANTVLFDSIQYEDINKFNIVYVFVKTLMFGNTKKVINKHSMKCYLKNVKRFESK